MAKIGFIGLGNMGLPMAQNLIKAGHDVTGFDVTPAGPSKLAEAGGRAAKEIGDAAAEMDFVITMLPAGSMCATSISATEAYSPARRRAPSSSTARRSTSKPRARDRGSGEERLSHAGRPGFRRCRRRAGATLTFMVGGTDAAFAKAQPVLEKMGKTIVHAGAAGAGQAAKICNNMILGISMIAVSEAFVLAEKLGLDKQKLFDISSKSSGQCWSMTTYCPVPGPVPTSPANRDYAAGFTAAMMLKDLKLAQEAAKAAGASTPLGANAAALYQKYADSGEAGRDFPASSTSSGNPERRRSARLRTSFRNRACAVPD